MRRALAAAGLAVLLLASCSDYFDTDSDEVVFADGYAVDTQRDAFYAFVGILQQLQQVGDRYVVLSELRGDLMTVTDNSSQDLRDVEDFAVEADNSYHFETDMYALVNSCNLLIERLDTAVVVDEEKVLKREMAQVKSIRAWAYLQLVTTYGEVWYTTEPVTDARADADCDTLRRDALLDVLIADLQPWVPADKDEAEALPDYGTIGDFDAAMLFIPVRFMLGELYLWKNDYENAARMFYEHMLANGLTVINLTNAWNGSTFTSVSVQNWTKLFSDLTSYEEMVTVVPFTDDYAANATQLPAMFGSDYLLAPSAQAIATWEDQTYAYDATTTTTGDLRGLYGSYEVDTESDGAGTTEYARITKYDNMDNYAVICRASLVYLRWAEAVNRLGRSNTAFTMLKYGLTPDNMVQTSYIPAEEMMSDGEPYYLDFGQNDLTITCFTGNIGMHTRGCGTLRLYRSYSIDEGVDTLEWVEDALVDELALETAFEGHRFQDLMRIALHRGSTDYLAAKVSGKFSSGTASAIQAALKDEANWYLPHEEQ